MGCSGIIGTGYFKSPSYRVASGMTPAYMRSQKTSWCEMGKVNAFLFHTSSYPTRDSRRVRRPVDIELERHSASQISIVI